MRSRFYLLACGLLLACSWGCNPSPVPTDVAEGSTETPDTSSDMSMDPAIAPVKSESVDAAGDAEAMPDEGDASEALDAAAAADAGEPADAAEPADAEAADAEAADAAENPEAEPAEQAAPAPEQEPAAESSDESSSEAAADATEPTVPLSNRVLLGTGELTAGIPGEGPLTNEQIQEWLDNPINHVPLEVELPLGLAAGRANQFIPEDNLLTRAKIELGRQLYFDTRLSVDNTVSCADCHHPDEGYARSTQFGVGVGGQQGGRNSPTSYNRILSKAQFWDGRAGSLEEQAVGPIANPIEMGNTHEQAVQTVASIEGYRMQFEKIFGSEVTIDNIGKALASFERVVVTGPAAFDYWEPVRRIEEAVGGTADDIAALEEEDPDLYDQYLELKEISDQYPMSESARRGYALFFGQKAGCTACHTGANFTDEKYHNLGVGMDKDEPDLGRFVVSGEEKDKGAFKTPTVRNVALTAPFMHDGSQKTLEEVVEWYDKGGHPNPYLSKDVRKLNLTAEEKADLVEFMKALTGPLPVVEAGRLPQ